MMRWIAVTAAVVCAGAASAQGLAGDLLGGALVNPRVGQWAWYDLTDKVSGRNLAVRQAIVGEERTRGGTGYWLEIEVVPETGYKTIIKALVVGPAKKPGTVKRLLFKSGFDPVVEAEIPEDEERPEDAAKEKRESIGFEEIETGSGAIRAERIRVVQGDVERTVWLSDDVPPTGIVRLQSPNGEWRLRNFGSGGRFGESIIDKAPTAEVGKEVRVEVEQEDPKSGEVAKEE